MKRREFVKFGLASGALISTVPWSLMAETSLQRSLHAGEILVNGKAFDKEIPIKLGDTIQTKGDAHIRFAINKDAFLIKGNSTVTIEGENQVVETIKVIAGGILSVFGSGRKTLKTKTATIGIRGTALYLHANEDTTYLCGCYGEIALDANDGLSGDEHYSETLNYTHHGSRVLHKDSNGALLVGKSGMYRHTDDELRLLESMVGRVTPF